MNSDETKRQEFTDTIKTGSNLCATDIMKSIGLIALDGCELRFSVQTME
jgi:hypothetical protein